jgi:hypothetical protein
MVTYPTIWWKWSWIWPPQWTEPSLRQFLDLDQTPARVR